MLLDLMVMSSNAGSFARRRVVRRSAVRAGGQSRLASACENLSGACRSGGVSRVIVQKPIREMPSRTAASVHRQQE